MKPEQLHEMLDEEDTKARTRREERAAAKNRTNNLLRREGACSADIGEVLDGFVGFLVKSAPEGVEVSSEGDEDHTITPPSSENPIEFRVAVERTSLPELGDGTVVATVEAYRHKPQRRLDYEKLHAATGFSVNYQFVPDEVSDGERVAWPVSFASENFDDSVLRRLPEPHVRDLERREEMVANAESDIRTLKGEAQSTLELLETAARDESLNPELAARLAQS